MRPAIVRREAPPAESALPQPRPPARSPLGQLLHALNQPLTGLQCSMEVAMASPRTAEQYVRGLREGLELTERMRALVEAIREVTDLGEESGEKAEAIELHGILRETVDDLAPVAEVKSVRIAFSCPPASCLAVNAARRTVAAAAFRLLESALSLALRGSVLAVDAGDGAAANRAQSCFRVSWHVGHPPSAFSRPELGLLIAQTGFERVGALWERERTESLESVTVRLPAVNDAPALG